MKVEQMSDHWEQISNLVHEGRLNSVTWDPILKKVTLVLHCLRRGSGGENLAPVPIIMTFSDIDAFYIGHNPETLSVKPEDYHLDRQLCELDLRYWDFPPQEFSLSVNSLQCQEDAFSTYIGEWILGSKARRVGSHLLTALTFYDGDLLGVPNSRIICFFACDEIIVESGGVALDLDTWTEQYQAWWNGWREHWLQQENCANDRDEEGFLEDVFIPAGVDVAPDPDYRPPSEPIFHLMPHDLPEEIIRPLQSWFESVHSKDWRRRAECCQILGRNAAEQAKDEEESFNAMPSWGYAREIDSWWLNDSLAQVEVRGIEHSMAFDDVAAESTERVWTFRLRKRGPRWVVRKWSACWPPKKGLSLARAAKLRPWLREWSSGKLVRR